MFDFYGIVSKEEKKEDLVQSKFEDIIYYIKFLKTIISKTKIFPNSQREKTKGELDNDKYSIPIFIFVINSSKITNYVKSFAFSNLKIYRNCN